MKILIKQFTPISPSSVQKYSPSPRFQTPSFCVLHFMSDTHAAPRLMNKVSHVVYKGFYKYSVHLTASLGGTNHELDN
jgi:hypothetical protein